ncbi:MAG: hypothetical protein ABJM06_05140 [Gilvibacter sp.]
MKAGIGKKTKGKLNSFLIFLGLSLLLWFLTKFSKEITNDVQGQLHLVGIPEGNMLMGEDLIPVRIQMQGTGFDYLYYAFNKPKIEVDVASSAIENNGTWVLPRIEVNSLASQQLSQDAEVQLPSNGLPITLEILATKKVAVKIMADVSYEEGFSPIDSYYVVPDSVTVSGPSSVIDTLSIVETERKAYVNVSQDLDDILLLSVGEDSNLNVNPDTVEFSLSVAEFIEDSRVIPIEVINVPPDTDVQLFPSSVTISYVIDFDNYKKILASDFKVVCDLSKASEDANLLAPELIRYPKTAKNVTMNTAQVEFIIIQ